METVSTIGHILAREAARELAREAGKKLDELIAGGGAVGSSPVLEGRLPVAGGLESTGEASALREAALGPQGMLEQLDTVRSASIESLATRNAALLEQREARLVHLPTRNEALEGRLHPETGIPFERDVVRLPDGTFAEGVFPDFPSVHDVQLPDGLREASDYRQAQYCNHELAEAVERNPELRSRFTEEQLGQLRDGETPDGFTWHHHQETGRMQLVDAELHLKTGHTGGKEIWGGGR